MPKMNNPASRLLRIVQGLKGQKKAEQLDVAFSQVLRSDGDYASLLRRIGYVLQLVERTKDCIEAQEVEHDVFLRHLEKIGKAFQGMHLGGQVQSLQQQIPDTAVVGLEFCAEQLSRSAGEGELSKDDREKLLAEIDGLLTTVQEADISDNLRQIIIESVWNLQQAIDEYDFLGSGPVIRASDAIFGAAIRSSPAWVNNEKAKPVWNTVIDVARKVYAVIPIVNNLAALPESVTKMLGM
jgi:hypothetical protein